MSVAADFAGSPDVGSRRRVKPNAESRQRVATSPICEALNPHQRGNPNGRTRDSSLQEARDLGRLPLFMTTRRANAAELQGFGSPKTW